MANGTSLPPPTGGDPPPTDQPWWNRRFAKLPAWAWITIGALVVIIGVAAAASPADDEDDASPATTNEQSDGDAVAAGTTSEPETGTSPATTEAVATTITTLPPTTTTSTTSTTTTSTTSTTTTLPPIQRVYEGAGDDVVDLEGSVTGIPFIVTAGNNGDSNFIVYALSDQLEELDLVVNTIGPSEGRYILNFNDSNPAFLRVEAEGGWRIQLDELSITSQPQMLPGEPMAGDGDDVVFYDGDPARLEYSNDGDSNFIIYSYSDHQDLVVNEIGPVSGTSTITAGPMILEISAEGGWSLLAQPV